MSTPLRSTQARVVLAGLLRGMAPHINVEALHDVVSGLALDKVLWLELELLAVNARPLPRLEQPEMEAPES